MGERVRRIRREFTSTAALVLVAYSLYRSVAYASYVTNFGGYADPETDQLLAGLCAAEPAGRAAAMTALCKKLADQAPIVPVCFKSYSVLLPAGAALQPITPTAANPFCGISDWKLNMK